MRLVLRVRVMGSDFLDLFGGGLVGFGLGFSKSFSGTCLGRSRGVLV